MSAADIAARKLIRNVCPRQALLRLKMKHLLHAMLAPERPVEAPERWSAPLLLLS